MQDKERLPLMCSKSTISIYLLRRYKSTMSAYLLNSCKSTISMSPANRYNNFINQQSGQHY